MTKRKRNNIVLEPDKPPLLKSILQNKKLYYPAAIFILVSILSFTIIIISSNLDQYPPGSDAFYYVQIGQYYNQIFDNFFDFLGGFISGSFTKADYEKYGFIESNPISTLFRSPVFGLYLGIVISLFGLSNISMALSQSLLNGLLFLLVYLIVIKIKNQKAAVISVLLLLFHVSVYLLIFYTLSETFLTVFLLLFIYSFILSMERYKKKYFFLTGVLLSLITLIKPSMQYYIFIFLPVLIFFIIMKNIPSEKIKKYIFAFIKGAAVILILWIFIFYRTTGKIDITARGLEGTNLLAGISVPYGGGQPAGVMFTPKEFREEVKNLKNIPPNWYQFYSNTALKAAVKYFINNPVNCFLLLIKKTFYLLESPPFNCETTDLVFSTYRKTVFPYYHRLLLVVFLLSLVFMKKYAELRIITFTIFIYLLTLHSAGLIGTRYLMPVIPFLVMFAGIIISNLNVKKINSFLNINGKKILFFLIIVVFNGIILFLSSPFILNYIFFNCSTMMLVQFIIRLALFIIDLKIISNLIKNYYTHIEKIIIFLFFFIIIFMYNILNYTNPLWGYWKEKINNKSALLQKITLPNDFNFQNYNEAYVVMNIFYENKIPKFNILLNNIQCTNKISSTNVTPIVYQNNEKWKPYDPQWFFIPINITDLKKTNFIKLTGLNNNLVISGNYYKKNNLYPSFIYFQRFSFIENTKSIDRRIYQKIDLLSAENKSFLLKNKENQDYSSKTLSLHKGRYQIFILLKRKGGYYIHKDYIKLSEINIKYLALLNLTDKGIIKWSDNLPDKDHILIQGNLINTVISEVDKFNSGYILY